MCESITMNDRKHSRFHKIRKMRNERVNVLLQIVFLPFFILPYKIFGSQTTNTPYLKVVGISIRKLLQLQSFLFFTFFCAVKMRVEDDIIY